MNRIAVVVFLILGACTAAPVEPATATITQYLAGTVHPAVVCDGITDDRAAIQLALNSGAAEVRIPAGVTCAIGQAGHGSYGITIPAGVTLACDPGSVLLQAPVPASVRMIEMDASGATLQDCTLDGNWTAQPDQDEHRAGVFTRAGVTLRRITARNFTGDGASLYIGSGYVLDHVTATGNRRDGISCVGTVDGVLIDHATLIGNSVQQLDLEPVTCSHVTLRDSLLDGHDASGALVSSDYVLAIAKGDDFVAEGSEINGPIDIVHSHRVTIERSHGTNVTMLSNVLVYQDSDAELRDNTFTATVARSIVQVTGISVATAQPSARLTRNVLTGNGTAALVYAQGANAVELAGNTLACTTAGTAIVARASLPAFPFGRLELRDNTATGCSRGLAVSGIGGTATDTQVIASGNMIGPATLDDGGTGALQFYLGDLSVTRYPTGAVLSSTVAGALMTRAP